MKRILLILPVIALLLPATAFAQKASELKYVDARSLMLINQGYDNTELTYSRLPADMKPYTRKAVWELGQNSAGLAIRFSSDSRTIGIRWTLLNYFIMHHMAGTGIRCKIHDIASNECEWTTEYSTIQVSDEAYPCIDRGGFCNDTTFSYVSTRSNLNALFKGMFNSFRPILYL